MRVICALCYAVERVVNSLKGLQRRLLIGIRLLIVIIIPALIGLRAVRVIYFEV
jgi:hypothetical protein